MTEHSDKYEIFRMLDREYGSQATTAFDTADKRQYFDTKIEAMSQHNTDSLVRAKIKAASFKH